MIEAAWSVLMEYERHDPRTQFLAVLGEKVADLRAALAAQPAQAGEAVASLVKAADGLLHTIAASVPCDAPWSFMLTRDVAEVSRALASIQGPATSRPSGAVEPASAEAVREACAKACDERAAESRRMEALCGSAKREWTDLDLQEEVTIEAVECAKACRSLPMPPIQASAGWRVDASLLPLADGLLRDAEDAIAAHAGPGQHVGTPKVTVDALRLRNVARAVAHALRVTNKED